VKRSYGRLSDTGTVFTTASNSFNGCSPDDTINLKINDNKFIRKYLDVFKRVGKLREHPETRWDGNVCKVIRTGKTYFTWCMTTKVGDFVKEYVTLGSDTPEPSVVQDNKEIIDDVTRVLVERVTRACWDQMFNVSKDLMSYEDLLKRVKNQLNIK
jgi:hypothetical protein